MSIFKEINNIIYYDPFSAASIDEQFDKLYIIVQCLLKKGYPLVWDEINKSNIKEFIKIDINIVERIAYPIFSKKFQTIMLRYYPESMI